MESERGFERERDWTQGPAKWAAVVVLGAACVLTSAWVMTGRVRVEREAGGAEREGAGAATGVEKLPSTLRLPVEAPGLAEVGEPIRPAIGPAVDEEATTKPEVSTEADARASGPDAISVARRININTASAAELELLPGVGPKLAQRIIDHRRQHGAFKTVDELDGVSGIGPRILERLRGMVTVE